MSSYYIVSELTNDGQQWAVTLQNNAIVVQPFTQGQTQKWEIRFQQGKTKAGIAFVNSNLTIAYQANNNPLLARPYEAVAGDNSSVWVIDSNQPNPWYWIVNPDNGMGQIWDVYGGNAHDGGTVGTWNENGGSNQHWKFVAV